MVRGFSGWVKFRYLYNPSSKNFGHYDLWCDRQSFPQSHCWSCSNSPKICCWINFAFTVDQMRWYNTRNILKCSFFEQQSGNFLQRVWNMDWSRVRYTEHRKCIQIDLEHEIRTEKAISWLGEHWSVSFSIPFWRRLMNNICPLLLFIFFSKFPVDYHLWMEL